MSLANRPYQVAGVECCSGRAEIQLAPVVLTTPEQRAQIRPR